MHKHNAYTNYIIYTSILIVGKQQSDQHPSFAGLQEYDHIAVSSVHAFLQNLYFYASENTEEYRRHLLMVIHYILSAICDNVHISKHSL